MNIYIIDQKNNKQPLYKLIYSSRPVELKTLKIYIEANLKDSFIQSFKSSTRVPIFFIRKSDSSLHF